MIGADRTGSPPGPPAASHGARPTFSILDGLDTAPLGVAVFDRELRFVHANAALAEANRIPVEAHLGRTIAELFPEHGGAAATVEAHVRAVLESGAPAVFAIVHSGPTERRREWMASVFAVRGASGSVDAACGIFADVTAEHEREATLARAREDAERTARRLGQLLEVTRALSDAADPAAVSEVVVERVRELIGASAAMLRGLHGDALDLLAASPDGELPDAGASMPLDAERPCSAAAATGEQLWLPDPRTLAARFPAMAASRAAAVAAVPLVVRGRTLGTLSLLFDSPQRFDLEGRALVLSVAEACAQALDRAFARAAEDAARQDAQRLADRLARLQEITAALSASRTPEEIARTIVDRAHAVVGAAVSVVYELDRATGHLRLLGTRGAEPELSVRFARVPVTAPFPACRAASGERVWLETRDAVHAAFPVIAALPEGERREAMIALPLRAGGAVVGAIGFSFDAPRRFDDAERSFFLSIAEQCGVALERARLLEDERRARAAAEQARAEADRTRAGLDALLGNAPLGIGFFDREFRFLRVNATLAAMNGAPAAAHLGKTPYEVLPPDPAVQRVEASWRRVLETGEPLLDVEVAADVPGAGGPRTWINSWYPVRSDGEIVGVGVLVREVTREREAQAFQRHVLAVVGHDLRNPLSAITFATSSLLRASPAPGQIRPLERIAGSAGRIVEIVGALLDYANVRDGGVPIRRRPCDVAEVARAVAEECQLAHPGSDVRCTGEGDSRGTWDPDRIAQVLANLVSNAIRHADRGTAVAVRCRGSDEGVAIEVENAGPAIAAEDAPRLFDPFRKGPSGGGLGLGLFIARALVDAHRGAIQVRSGGGRTVFEVRLPRR